MSFTHDTLSDFLSSIFIIGMGHDLRKSLDEGAMMDNFEEWIIGERKNLGTQKASFSRLWSKLRPILMPIICGDGDHIGLHQSIKNQIIENYPMEIHSERLEVSVEEAMISAARKVYNFFEIIAQELELGSDLESVDSETEWGDNLLEDISLEKGKTIPEALDVEAVLKEVFYKETQHYIIHHLERPVIPKSLVFIEENARVEPGVKALREEFKHTSIFELQWGNLPMRCRVVLILSILLGGLFAPAPLLTGCLIWDLWQHKRIKERQLNASLESRSSLFKAQKAKSQRLPRPRELMSDDEGSGRNFLQG